MNKLLNYHRSGARRAEQRKLMNSSRLSAVALALGQAILLHGAPNSDLPEQRPARAAQRPRVVSESDRGIETFRLGYIMEYSGSKQTRLQLDVLLRTKRAPGTESPLRYEITFASPGTNHADAIVDGRAAYAGLQPKSCLAVERNVATQRLAGRETFASLWSAACNDLLSQIQKVRAGSDHYQLLLPAFDRAGSNQIEMLASERRVNLDHETVLVCVRAASSARGIRMMGGQGQIVSADCSFRSLWIFNEDRTRLYFSASRFEAASANQAPPETFRIETMMGRLPGSQGGSRLPAILELFAKEVTGLQLSKTPLPIGSEGDIPAWAADALILARQATLASGIIAERKTNPGPLAAIGIFFAADAVASALMPSYHGLLPTVGEYLGASIGGTEEWAQFGKLAGTAASPFTPGLLENMGNVVKF